MRSRAIVLGLLCAAFISGYAHFNDFVMRQGRMVSNLMPVVVFGGLLLFLMLGNPLLRRLKREWALTGRDLSIILGFSLVACSVPSYGIVQCLPTSIMLPHYYQQTRPAWKSLDVTAMAPRRMLPDIAPDEERILKGYVTGLGQGDRHVSPRDVPWRAWLAPLGFWLPLLLSMAVGVIGLAVVFHRQWSRHEQLPYPITRFARELLPADDGRPSPILQARSFWIGFILVFGILFNNYLCRWWPQALIAVRLQLDFTPFSSLVPTLVEGHGLDLLRPNLLFTVIGMSYFLASDVSFSMAVGPFIFCTIAGILSKYGIALRTGHHQSVKIEAFLFTGGYTGIVLMLLYTGRHYYWHVLRACFGLQAASEVTCVAAWGMRLFLAGMLGFIAQLVVIGLAWPLALLYTTFCLIVFCAVSRTIAETGAFYIGTEVFPGAILWGFCGAVALGPQQMLIMFLITVVLLVGPGWAPMPFMVQAIKVTDDAGVAPSRTLSWSLAVLALSVAIALPAILYIQYDRGALSASGSWPVYAATFPWENMVEIRHKLEAQGVRALADSLHGLQRLGHLQPTWPAVAAFVLAVATSVGFGLGRLRFARWPLHPVIFVFLGGAQALTMSGSFLIGWLIKSLVSRYGGEKAYQALKPFMIGIIAGDMVGQFLPMLVGTAYHLLTGNSP